jgi:hypothetical protein
MNASPKSPSAEKPAMPISMLARDTFPPGTIYAGVTLEGE